MHYLVLHNNMRAFSKINRRWMTIWPLYTDSENSENVQKKLLNAQFPKSEFR